MKPKTIQEWVDEYHPGDVFVKYLGGTVQGEVIFGAATGRQYFFASTARHYCGFVAQADVQELLDESKVRLSNNPIPEKILQALQADGEKPVTRGRKSRVVKGNQYDSEQ